MDFLRPLITLDEQEEPSKLLWEYVGSFLHTLASEFADERQGTLLNLDDLIDEVEIYVGAITMLQLFVLLRQRLPSLLLKESSFETTIRGLHKLVEKNLQLWKGDKSMEQPENSYRLNLLEISLQQLVMVLDSGDK